MRPKIFPLKMSGGPMLVYSSELNNQRTSHSKCDVNSFKQTAQIGFPINAPHPFVAPVSNTPINVVIRKYCMKCKKEGHTKSECWSTNSTSLFTGNQCQHVEANGSMCISAKKIKQNVPEERFKFCDKHQCGGLHGKCSRHSGHDGKCIY